MGPFANSTSASARFSGDRKDAAGIHQAQAGYDTGTCRGQFSGNYGSGGDTLGAFTFAW
jgi:hypothetical protein